MNSYIRTSEQPCFVTHLRRLSKSNFLQESNNKNPRLEKMVAHITLFDRTTKCIEEDIQTEVATSLAAKRANNRKANRPGMKARSTEYEHRSEPVPSESWIAELTCKPPSNECIYVTEVEEVEVADDD